MLDALLHHKKEDKDYLCALVVTEDRIDAALWETDKSGKVTVLNSASVPYEGEWEKAIDAADSAVTQIESGLPEGIELTKVVFGLFPEWLSEDHIKETYLKRLKQLTLALSLKPMGFVELPTAIAHLLHQDEGTHQTVILVGAEKKFVTVSLFKIGKPSGTLTLPRTETVSVDIEKALTSFTDIEVLPSRILLYGTADDLEKVKAEMLSYPWQKKANFLHFPKIEALAPEYAVKAVAAASATELTPQEAEMAAENNELVAAPAIETTPNVVIPPADEVAAVAQDLGFVAETEDDQITAEPASSTTSTDQESSDEAANVSAPPSTKPKLALPALPHLALPKLTFKVKVPQIPKVGMLLVIVGALFLVGIATSAAVWLLPKATVKVLVQPKAFDKTEEITVDTSIKTMDADKKILPGTVVKTDVTGSQSAPTSGKKTVGDKAKGEVTIFNKTLNTKTFKKGTQLAAGKLIFSLDSDTTIASASEGIGSLTYGNAKATISAKDIGSTSNLGAGTDFTFEELPTTSYSSRNEKALAGGTSKEISVVSRDDQKAAREKAVAALEKQATDKLTGQIGSGEKLLDKSLVTEITAEKYSKEIGEEAAQVEAQLTVSISAATYNEADFAGLVDKVIGANISSEYEYKKDTKAVSIDDITIPKDGVWIFKPHLRLALLPKIETKDFISHIAGKTFEQASAYLKQQAAVAGVAYDISTQLPFLANTLPFNPANIKIETSSL